MKCEAILLMTSKIVYEVHEIGVRNLKLINLCHRHPCRSPKYCEILQIWEFEIAIRIHVIHKLYQNCRRRFPSIVEKANTQFGPSYYDVFFLR